MKKRIFSILFAVVLLLGLTVTPVMAAKPADKGFDENGFNYQARIFVGTGESWAMGKFGMGHDEAEAYMGLYAHDKLVMKWSKAWDDARFGSADWTSDAWETNEWNGMFPGGSGETWHYKIVWIGPGHGPDGTVLSDGGYVIWGQFEVILSHGTVGGEHLWDAHAIPCGFGGP